MTVGVQRLAARTGEHSAVVAVPGAETSRSTACRARPVAHGRCDWPLLDGADATALVGDDGAADPEKVKAAVTELLGRKPHYARRISGDVGQGARPGPADPNEELWGIIQSRTR